MLKIDLYGDLVCPWCIIGQYRLDKVLSERFPNLGVDIEHHPYELMPDAPPDGLRLADFFKEKFVANIERTFGRLASEARAAGLHLNLSGHSYVAYRTIFAHTLLRVARVRGTQHGLAVALMRAFFQEQRNISDWDTLSDIASHHGFLPGEVRTLLQDAGEIRKTEQQIMRTRKAGVRALPTFRFGSLMSVGLRPEDEIAEEISDALRR